MGIKPIGLVLKKNKNEQTLSALLSILTAEVTHSKPIYLCSPPGF
jgi:hypothetical protein